MKYHFTSYGVVAMVVVGVLFLFVSMPAAQEKAPVASADSANEKWCIGCSVDGKTTPRTPDGHPDLSGFWNRPLETSTDVTLKAGDGSIYYDHFGTAVDDLGRWNSDLQGSAFSEYADTGGFRTSTADPARQPPYKPEYRARVEEIVRETYGATTALDPMMDCKPLGVPRGATGIMHIVQSPTAIAILYEKNPGTTFRLIYTDGRPHPEGLDTSHMGHSIGHWEGDTLVVDVAGLNDETWLGGGHGGPRYAAMHSDQEHVIERWTREGDVITYEATVEDPVMFTKPWVIRPRRISLSTGGNDYLMPAMCSAFDATSGVPRKAHMIKPSEEDSYICNHCNPNDAKWQKAAAPAEKGSGTY